MRIIDTLAFVLVFAGTLSFTIAQDQIPTEDELIKTIPGLSYILDYAGFNISNFQTEKLLREKCEKYGGPSASGVAKQGLESYSTCVKSLVNPTEFQAEIQYARPRGDMDEVFGKYCRRVPYLRNCVRNVTATVKPCLDSEERKNIEVIHKITDSVLKFICYGDGGRIAMFIATGGIECFEENREIVSACAKENFNGYIIGTNTAGVAAPKGKSIPQLVLGLQQCMNIAKFRTCAVNALEVCKDPTPANVLDALLNFVKRSTPCEKLLEDEGANALGSTSGGSTNIIDVLLITTAMAMYLQFA